jgi:hypothetical protein
MFNVVTSVFAVITVVKGVKGETSPKTAFRNKGPNE